MKVKIDAELALFEAVSLQDIEHVKLMDRMDTKFAFPVRELAELLHTLRNDYRVLEVSAQRCVLYKTLYFDDKRFTFFHDHHREKMSRYKVRVRQYTNTGVCFLEVKHKYKGRTVKNRIPLSGMPETLEGNALDFIRKRIPGADPLEACLHNSFYRITLVGKHTAERLTLDFHIRFNWNESSASMENLVISELKQEQVDRNSPFFRLMRQRNIRPYRLSKYCLGTMQVHRDKTIKSNRFKRKMLILKKIEEHA